MAGNGDSTCRSPYGRAAQRRVHHTLLWGRRLSHTPHCRPVLGAESLMEHPTVAMHYLATDLHEYAAGFAQESVRQQEPASQASRKVHICSGSWARSSIVLAVLDVLLAHEGLGVEAVLDPVRVSAIRETAARGRSYLTVIWVLWSRLSAYQNCTVYGPGARFRSVL